MSSIELTPENVKKYDAVVVITDHTDVDYELVRENAHLIIDSRNVYKLFGKLNDGNIVKA